MEHEFCADSLALTTISNDKATPRFIFHNQSACMARVRVRRTAEYAEDS
jgi:hypothetical protein